MDLVILVASLWVMTTALGAIGRARREPPELEDEEPEIAESTGKPF